MDHIWAATCCGAADSTAWDEIDKAVAAEVGRIRVGQKVFPTVQMPDAPNVSLDQFNAQTMTIDEGLTSPFVEISLAFSLTRSQVDNEASLRKGRTLALLASKTHAQAEDEILLPGQPGAECRQQSVPGPPDVPEHQLGGGGLLGLVNAELGHRGRTAACARRRARSPATSGRHRAPARRRAGGAAGCSSGLCGATSRGRPAARPSMGWSGDRAAHCSWAPGAIRAVSTRRFMPIRTRRWARPRRRQPSGSPRW